MNLKVNKLVTVLFLVSVSFLKSYCQNSGIALKFNDTELISILDKVEKETGYFFLFNEKLIDTKQKITININCNGINELLTILFANTGIKYSVIDNKIILAPDYLTNKQKSQTVSGTVLDENRNPFVGVNIHLMNTNEGIVSDSRGKYSINYNGTGGELIFSFIGYKQVEVQINSRSTVNVSMVPTISNLNEVIVIGYGTTKKSDLTGSIVALAEKSYNTQPVSRLDDILQGRSAGVNVTNVSGAPGGSTTIRIRGSNSITGTNEPLYVVDGFVGVNMEDINPTDIESIQILKDASSTAIYGSRGANGVVLLTTKNGRSGKPQFSIAARYYSGSPLKLWPLLNASEFANICNERADILGNIRPFTLEQCKNFSINGGTNWQDLIYRRAGGEEIQLNFSGGSDDVTYFISGNILDQDGIIINSDFKRYSLRSNIEARLSNRLKGSLKINFARRESNNTSGNFNTSSVVAGATAWAPTTPAYNVDGGLTTFDPTSSVKSNPLELASNDNIIESNGASANLNVNYQILDGLSFDLGFGGNYTNAQTKSFAQRLLTNAPSAARSSVESVFLQNTDMLTYSKQLSELSSLIITGVAEYQLQQSDNFSATANNLLFPILKYNNITLAKSYLQSSNFGKSTIGSYIGRVSLNIRNRYLFTGSLRSDRSSKFRKSNQQSIFPSVGLGWRISEENFLKQFPVFSNLKLRASWGITGSQAIDVYGTVTSYNTSSALAGSSWLNGTITPGINIGNPGNEDLKWESTSQTNIGFDIGILKEKLTLEADYFYKKTKDLLLDEPLPGYMGGGIMYRNIGSVENNGFEVNLNSRLSVRNTFLWEMNLNFSYIRNIVADLGDNPYILRFGGAGAGMVTSPEMILRSGYNISSYYGFKSLGVWQVSDEALAAKYGQKPGDYRYDDVNGDYAFTGDDFQILGSGMPKFLLGFNNYFTYKRFTLNVFLQSMLSYQKWNFAYAQTMIAAADAREYTHRDILNRWSSDNPKSRVAAFSKTNVPRIQSSEYIENGNYLRFKNISLQYTIPETSLKWGSITIMLSAQNLFTLTKYRGLDPETYSNLGTGDIRGGDGGAYPNAKTWCFGLNLNF
jgi:TonB-dependent starch-binding outer membrane protein SusC